MKLVQKTFLKGGTYTFLITLALILISKIIGVDDYGNYQLAVTLELYLVTTLCGFIMAFAELIFETKLDIIIKRAAHFLSVLIGFVIVFAVSGMGGGSVGKRIFIAIVIYIVCYVLLSLIFFLAKRIYAKITANGGKA